MPRGRRSEGDPSRQVPALRFQSGSPSTGPALDYSTLMQPRTLRADRPVGEVWQAQSSGSDLLGRPSGGRWNGRIFGNMPQTPAVTEEGRAMQNLGQPSIGFNVRTGNRAHTALQALASMPPAEAEKRSFGMRRRGGFRRMGI